MPSQQPEKTYSRADPEKAIEIGLPARWVGDRATVLATIARV